MAARTTVILVVAQLAIVPLVAMGLSLLLIIYAADPLAASSVMLVVWVILALVVAMCVVGCLKNSTGHLMRTGRSWGLGISAFFAFGASIEITDFIAAAAMGHAPSGDQYPLIGFRLLLGLAGWLMVIKTIRDAARDARKTPDGEPDEELGATMASDHEG